MINDEFQQEFDSTGDFQKELPFGFCFERGEFPTHASCHVLGEVPSCITVSRLSPVVLRILSILYLFIIFSCFLKSRASSSLRRAATSMAPIRLKSCLHVFTRAAALSSRPRSKARSAPLCYLAPTRHCPQANKGNPPPKRWRPSAQSSSKAAPPSCSCSDRSAPRCRAPTLRRHRHRHRAARP